MIGQLGDWDKIAQSPNYLAKPFGAFDQLGAIIVGKAQAQVVVERAGGGKFVAGPEADFVAFRFGQ